MLGFPAETSHMWNTDDIFADACPVESRKYVRKLKAPVKRMFSQIQPPFNLRHGLCVLLGVPCLFVAIGS